MKSVPYLTFPGTCEEALTLYSRVFGREATIMRFGEMPPDDAMPISEAWKDKIMHAAIDLGGGEMLYFSDIFEGGSVTAGDNITVHIEVDSEGDVRRFFDGLSEGATITMPIETQFWGAVYGSLIDRFGINWGFHFDLPRE